jgi:hypothetical protein
VQTSFGVFELKYFFNEKMLTLSGEEVATREIKDLLIKLIAEEDKTKPFSEFHVNNHNKSGINYGCKPCINRKVMERKNAIRHKSKEQISQEKNVLQIIINDSVDDIIPLLTQSDATRLKEFQTAFWASVDDLAYEMAQIYLGGNTVYPDKKDFAVEFVQKRVLPIHAPIMYAMKGGKGSHATIIDMISKSLTTQTKIDQNRWLWGGLKWNC